MITFRKVEPSDIPQLREIASKAFKQHRFWLDMKLDTEKVGRYYVEDLTRLLNAYFGNPDSNDFTVAVEGHKIVGYIALRIDDLLSSIFAFKWGVISSFALREGYRQKGLGSEMLVKALEWFASKNVSKVDVSTDSENIAAIQCYEKTGFRTIYSGVTLTLDLNQNSEG